MTTTRAVTRVATHNTPEESLRRLVLASASTTALLPGTTLGTLIQFAALAHPTGGEGDIVSASLPAADLDRLEFVGYPRLADDGAIELL